MFCRMKMQNNSDDFDGFMVNVFYDEDGDYLAHLVELPNVSAFGSTPNEALEELKSAWELMKECYVNDGEHIPEPTLKNGHVRPYNIPIEPELFYSLTNEASRTGISLYALITHKLKSSIKIGHEDSIDN